MSVSPRPFVSPLNDTKAYSATSITLFDGVANVTSRSIFNNSDRDLFIYFSASPATTTTANSRKIAAGATFDFPTPVYNNIVTGIGASGGAGSYNTTQYV